MRPGVAEPTTRPLPRLETGMHTVIIRQVTTDAAGRWAVTASDDKTARVWEVASGRQLTVLRPPQDVGNEGKLYAVALSPDGAVVAVGGWTGLDWDKKVNIYLFDRASGRLLRRLPGLPSTVHHLAFSPDGRWLAASLGITNGVRIFEATRGEETGRDAAYSGASHSVHFSPDGRRLLATSWDGQVRLYAVKDGTLDQRTSARLGGGQRPSIARFSPDGRRIAVGFEDSTVVQVLDAETLKEVARPSTVGVDNGNLRSVAWSADGRFLVAGGRWNRAGGKHHVRRWAVDVWSQYSDVPMANNTVVDLMALPGSGLLFAAADPAWGVLNAAGQIQSRQDSASADLRGPDQLRLSADGRRVRFGYQWPSQDAGSFDLVSRNLGADDSALSAARTAALGLDIQNWRHRTDPTLNGQPLKLRQYEASRSLAIAINAERFVLGADWRLRLFDRAGREVWRQPVPGTTWAVNISADGRFVVAGYGDGTIRWHRLSNGEEVLALFPHADRQRWIAWTPEGFYATSGPDAEEFVGYHLNRGKEREGEFISARQLREHFYQPGLISQRLDANGDALVAEAVQKLGDVRELLAGAKAPAPIVELLSDAQITTAGDVPIKVRITDRGGGIGRLIYRIDGIEFEGRMVGIAADGTDSRTFTLPPQQRSREITVSATNARGVESVPVRIVARVQPRPSAAPSLHVLAIGVSFYRDRELQKGVRFAARDADTIGQLFRDQGARLYRSVNVRVLSDAQATGDAIRTVIAELASQIAAQDVFVLYLAGHGASFDRDYHFLPWDAVYTSTAALRQRSLTHEHFRSLLAKIPATKTVVLLDTCSAGGFGRQDGRDIGEKDAIDRLSRLTGRAMIAATADAKMAIEGEGGHGAFTFALLEGLRGQADRNRNGTVEVRELADYVEERLPEITRKWGYEQFPFSATEGNSFTLVPKKP
jgi:WD40 repeat protein